MDKKEAHNDQYVVKKGVTEIEAHIRQYKYPHDSDAILEEFEGYHAEMLRGLWDSEGWVRKDGRIGFANGHQPTCKIYCKLLLSVVDIDPDNVSVYERSERFYNVMIPYRFGTRFFDSVNPTIKRKHDKFDSVSDNKTASDIVEANDSILDDFKK